MPWGEALLLFEAWMNDPSTPLGAEVAGWAYPASMPQILLLSATIRDEKAAREVMPWVMRLSDDTGPTDEELARAQAELEAGIVFG